MLRKFRRSGAECADQLPIARRSAFALARILAEYFRLVLTIHLLCRSIDVVPGKKFNLPVERDFRITNACLGELVDETGRSLVKVSLLTT